MAKIQGLTGKMSGKMGSAVFRVRQGEQIVTQYNPIVKNPNTEAQSTQRVAFKLMSQVAAAMASAIINRPARQGQSARNRFVQQNFHLVTADPVNAKVEMERLQLTSSSTFLGTMTHNNTNKTVVLEDINPSVTKVRFVKIAYPSAGDKSKPVVFAMVDVNVENETATTSVDEGETILAYGIIPTSGAAKVSLDNMGVDPTQPFIAQVNLERMVATGQIAVTETLGVNATTLGVNATAS